MSTLDLSVISPRLAGLVRRGDSGLGTGLAAALADRLGLDVTLVRVAFVAGALIGGLGIAAYTWGTLLTAREGGTVPVLRLLPGFGSWQRSTQLLIMGTSSIVVTALWLGQLAASMGAVAVAGLIIHLVLRRRRAARRARAATLAAGADQPRPSEIALPLVDLYRPPEPVPVTRLPDAGPTRSWWAGLGFTLAAAVAAVATHIIGATTSLLPELAAASLALGCCLVVWALVARHRRLPSLVLLLATVLAAATAGLGLAAAEAGDNPSSPPAAGGAATYYFTGERDGVVDLRDVPRDSPVRVTVVARASAVRVLLPGTPSSLVTTARLAVIEPPDRGRAGDHPASHVDLQIDGTASLVEVGY